MTTLQIVITVVWGVIGFGVVYSIGSRLGGRKAGIELCMAIIATACLYSAIGALGYFTLKAISQAFA